MDLTGQDVPWEAIGQLDALEELSLWNCGLVGPIEAAALCRLRRLRIMAVSQNALHGTVPECIAELNLETLWLEENHIRGPISEYSSLGQYLKNVNSLNLGKNRWAPLLRAEKAALEGAAEPLGVTAAEQDWAGHIWDFGWSYEWSWAVQSESDRQTAEREVSRRYWAAGIRVVGFAFALPFEFPYRGNIGMTASIGRDGDMVVGSEATFTFVTGVVDPMQSSFVQPMCRTIIDEMLCGNSLNGLITLGIYQSYEECLASCNDGDGCTAGQWLGFNQGCVLYGVPGAVDDTCTGQRRCPASLNVRTFIDCNSPMWSLAPVETGVYPHETMECWKTISALIPAKHVLSEVPEAAASSQGADYLNERFCPGWAKFIAPAVCDAAEPHCSVNDASGSAIFDGGGDMYDLGNILTSSLMGDCISDPHDCPLGSLRYRSDFTPVETSCFGPNGHYQMAKLEGVWVFFTHNAADVPLDFAVAGNLGSDGSGSVTEYIFEAAPYIGFVKRECGAGNDPSVSHLIIVDGAGSRLVHSCDHTSGGACDGAMSDLDDDAVSGIVPGSPILYLLYASKGGRCIKEDEHHAVFDVAVRCLWAEEPFEAMHQKVGNQPEGWQPAAGGAHRGRPGARRLRWGGAVCRMVTWVSAAPHFRAWWLPDSPAISGDTVVAAGGIRRRGDEQLDR
jgi:hypothetical protein